MGVLDEYTYNTGKTGGDNTVTFGDKLLDGVSNIAKSIVDPSKLRLSLTGLLSTAKTSKSNTNINWASTTGKQYSSGVLEDDWRVRLSVAPGSSVLYDFYNNTFLQPLLTTKGVIFPITPNIQVTHTAKYTSTSLTHSNYGMHFYEGSEVGSINISGEFPIQNIEEGQYLLAAIYFFRAATKMYWGEDKWAGTPPPMLFLNGYGQGYFPNVSCVVTSFVHTLPDNVDYIDVPSVNNASQFTRLPTSSQLQVTLQPIMSRTKAHNFDHDKFSNGDLITKGYI